MVAEEGYVDFRGYRTWYRIVGERNSGTVPLLALHGGPGSTHNYFGPLERLADERPVVLYDQIGCGNSDRPTDVEWNVSVFRDEVDVLREQLGLERIHLLGTSISSRRSRTSQPFNAPVVVHSFGPCMAR